MREEREEGRGQRDSHEAQQERKTYCYMALALFLRRHKLLAIVFLRDGESLNAWTLKPGVPRIRLGVGGSNRVANRVAANDPTAGELSLLKAGPSDSLHPYLETDLRRHKSTLPGNRATSTLPLGQYSYTSTASGSS